MQRHLDCIWICNWIRISNIDKDFVLLLVILKWIWPNYSPKQLPWHFNSFYFSIRSIYILIKFSIKWNSKNMVNKYYVLSSLLEMFYFECLKCLFFIWKVLYATWLTKYEVSLFFFSLYDAIMTDEGVSIHYFGLVMDNVKYIVLWEAFNLKCQPFYFWGLISSKMWEPTRLYCKWHQKQTIEANPFDFELQKVKKSCVWSLSVFQSVGYWQRSWLKALWWN